MAKRKREGKCVMVIDANVPKQMKFCRGVEDFEFIFWSEPDIGKILAYVWKVKPEAILLGFRFPGTCVNGADMARVLYGHECPAILAGNSPGGAEMFNDRGVILDFYVNQQKRRFRQLLERIRKGTI